MENELQDGISLDSYLAAKKAPRRRAPTTGPKFSVRRVRLNAGGYDSSGRYFGADRENYSYETRLLFVVESLSSGVDWRPDFYLRETDREAVKAEVRRMIPNARFSR